MRMHNNVWIQNFPAKFSTVARFIPTVSGFNEVISVYTLTETNISVDLNGIWYFDTFDTDTNEL